MMNEQKGNMYGFVTHTYNAVKGKCIHDCKYCYMKGWGEQKPIKLHEKELKTDMGENNFIFVGSSTDMFASNVPDQWIRRVLEHCNKYPKNKYLFQTKNPQKFLKYEDLFPKKTMLCVTLESDISHKEMNNAPHPVTRYAWMTFLKHFDTMVTIEPIMRFNHDNFVEWIQKIGPKQVNIGADSKRHGLQEPTKEEINHLIDQLKKFTTVHLKDNLKRLIDTK